MAVDYPFIVYEMCVERKAEREPRRDFDGGSPAPRLRPDHCSLPLPDKNFARAATCFLSTRNIARNVKQA